MSKAGIDCVSCGVHDMDAPFHCPKGGELDDTDEFDTGHFADGMYYVDGWCDHDEGHEVLIQIEEWMIDPANTAPHVQKYAVEKGYPVQVEYEVRSDGNGNTRDVVVWFNPNEPEKARVLGQYYTQCVRRSDEIMEKRVDDYLNAPPPTFATQEEHDEFFGSLYIGPDLPDDGRSTEDNGY